MPVFWFLHALCVRADEYCLTSDISVLHPPATFMHCITLHYPSYGVQEGCCIEDGLLSVRDSKRQGREACMRIVFSIPVLEFIQRNSNKPSHSLVQTQSI
jgi:hypothetical protein